MYEILWAQQRSDSTSCIRTFPSSDRIALPSAMVSSSTARYLALMLSSSLLALTQKGQRVQLNTTTCKKKIGQFSADLGVDLQIL
jgi:hypothetical protein